MSTSWLFVGVLLLATVTTADAGDKEKKPLAGWYGVFPELTNYERKFEAPVTDPERRTTAYRQLAIYEWLGGRLETLTITLARDPNFKTQFSAETIRKRPKAATEVTVRGKMGWLLDSNHLVLVLGEDKALIIRRVGDGPDLTQVARQFNPEALIKALGQSPRIEPSRKLEHFKGLKKGSSYPDLVAWVGQPDEDIGSGIHVLVYELSDGSRVLVGTADLRQINYIKHVQKNGATEDLAR